MRSRKLFSYVCIFISCFLNIPTVYSSELLCYSFNEPVQGRHLFSVFRHRGLPKGWGLAFYPDKSLQLFKEPKKAQDCNLANFLTGYEFLNAPLLIAHVKGTTGVQTSETTQPFQRELKGKRYAFTHCGSLSNYQQQLKLERFKPVGPSDSEHLFCYLLGLIEKEGIQTWSSNKFTWLQGILRGANGFGNLHCAFSDGEYLFVYQDLKNATNFLHIRQRKAPFETVHFVYTNEDIDLSKVYPNSASGYIICMKPLTTEQWSKIGAGQMIVFKNGDIIWEGSTPIIGGEINAKKSNAPFVSIRNYPNPFTRMTTIHFSISRELSVSIEICDVKGEVVRVLDSRVYPSGNHTVTFDGKDDDSRHLGNGIYLVRLKASGFVETRELIISK